MGACRFSQTGFNLLLENRRGEHRAYGMERKGSVLCPYATHYEGEGRGDCLKTRLDLDGVLLSLLLLAAYWGGSFLSFLFLRTFAAQPAGKDQTDILGAASAMLPHTYCYSCYMEFGIPFLLGG